MMRADKRKSRRQDPDGTETANDSTLAVCVGVGLALGSGMGVAFGAAFGNVALGIALGPSLGLCLGCAAGVVISSSKARKNDAQP